MKRQALVIGINEYWHFKNLKSAVDDADAITTILEEQGNFNVKRMPSYTDDNNRMRVHPTPSILSTVINCAFFMALFSFKNEN